MTDRKYQILSKEILFQGFYRMERYHIRHERFDGHWSKGFTREVFHRSQQAAGVLLFDPQQDSVVMVEQFRSGPLLTKDDPWMLEVVMGMVETNEMAEAAARREAMEEAGCTVTDMQPIATYYSSPGGTSEQICLFVGRTQAPLDGGLYGILEENEDIRVHVIDAARAIGLLYSNKVRDAQTMVALQWFAMHHTELRSRWLVSDVGTPII